MNDIEQEIKDNYRVFIEQQLFRDPMRFVLFFFSPTLLGVKRQFRQGNDIGYSEMADLAMKLENSRGFAIRSRIRSIIEDRKFFHKYGKPGKFQIVPAELAIMVIARNEGRYLDEWLSYYKILGVDHIYFIDNKSTDNTKNVLDKYVKSGFVTYIPFNGEKAQLPAYRFLTKKIRKSTKWLAFIDADEFLYTRDEDIKTFLRRYEQYPGLVVNWIVFGPCGHEKRPEGYVTDNYTLTFRDPDNELNLRVKTIAQATEIADIRSPHYVTYKKGRLAVDENMKPVDGSFMLVPGAGRATTAHNSTKLIRINHYWTKSLEELREKCNRGYAAGRDDPQYNNILKRLNYPLVEDEELAIRCREMRAKSKQLDRDEA